MMNTVGEIQSELEHSGFYSLDSKIEEFANGLGLGSIGLDKDVSELSGGQRSKVLLTKLLLQNSKILLLDEPFSALDYQTRLAVSGDIGHIIRTTGKTAILITHDLAEAISLADRIIVLSKPPAYVKKEVCIHLTYEGSDPLAARSAPEFQQYFNLLWKELSYEK